MNNLFQQGVRRQIFIWMLACLSQSFLKAATLTVTSPDDDGIGSLRQAIATAVSGDTISFNLSGPIILTSAELLISANVAISGPGPRNLVIMRSAAATQPFRIFNITGGIVSISGLTISNGLVSGTAGNASQTGTGTAGSAAWGGGILNQSILTITDCIIAANRVVGGTGGAGGSGGGSGGNAQGGGIFTSGSLVMNDCLLISNSTVGGAGGNCSGVNFGYAGQGGAATGGAIYSSAGFLGLTNTSVVNNSVRGGDGGAAMPFTLGYGAAGGEADGGGIYQQDGPANLFNVNVSGNSAHAGPYGAYGASSASGSAASGGAICLNEGMLTLGNATVSSNTVTAGDGGGYVGNGGAGGLAQGGAIFVNRGSIAISGDTFCKNHAVGGNGTSAHTSGSAAGGGGYALGGAIACANGTVQASSSTFCANIAAGGDAGGGGRNGPGTAGGGAGGAMCWNSGTGMVVCCTIASNSTTLGSGSLQFLLVNGSGGIHNGPFSSGASNLVILNAIVGQNSGATNPWDLAGSFLSLGSNLAGVTNGSWGWIVSDQCGSSVAPLDARLAPLANNGGPTLTMSLLPGSPAIETGNDAALFPPYNLTTDQRGFARKSGPHTDIGAFELQQLVLVGAAQSGNDVLVSFSSEFGEKYRIDGADSLVGPWTTVADNVPGNGSTVQVIDIAAANRPQRFYRGQILLPPMP